MTNSRRQGRPSAWRRSGGRLRLADQQTKERFAALPTHSAAKQCEEDPTADHSPFTRARPCWPTDGAGQRGTAVHGPCARLPKSYGVQGCFRREALRGHAVALCVKTDRQMAAARSWRSGWRKSYSLEKRWPGSGDGIRRTMGCCPSRELLARAWCRQETRTGAKRRSRSGRKELNASRFSRRWREISQRRDPAHRPAGRAGGEEITLGVREERSCRSWPEKPAARTREPTAEAEYFQAGATLDEAQEIMAEEAVAEAADNGHSLPSMSILPPWTTAALPEGRGRCGKLPGGQQDKRRS